MLPLGIDAAQRLLEDDPRVVAAYLFGSRARGEEQAESDVDLAVLLDQPPSLAEELRLRAGLTDALGSDAIDLAILNSAPPLLRFEVISAGRRLFARHPRAMDMEEHRWQMEYLDTRHLRTTQKRLAREALAR